MFAQLGCTFWGKKPWSRKKKLMWQLGTLVGAPVGIALIAGISIPAMIIGIPVWVGRKIHSRYQTSGKHKRNIAITSGVTASVSSSPSGCCRTGLCLTSKQFMGTLKKLMA